MCCTGSFRWSSPCKHSGVAPSEIRWVGMRLPAINPHVKTKSVVFRPLIYPHSNCSGGRSAKVIKGLKTIDLVVTRALMGGGGGSGVHTAVTKVVINEVQGNLAHKKTHTPLGPPWYPRHRPAVGS